MFFLHQIQPQPSSFLLSGKQESSTQNQQNTRVTSLSADWLVPGILSIRCHGQYIGGLSGSPAWGARGNTNLFGPRAATRQRHVFPVNFRRVTIEHRQLCSMPSKILCVAEKPSIAKAVSGHMSGGRINVRTFSPVSLSGLIAHKYL